MKKRHDFMYRFKSQCTSINELFSKLEGCPHSRQKNNSKTFPPLGNKFLPPSENITLTNDHIMYPMKQKDLCDYYPRCIMSSSLMFDDIIISIISKNEFLHPTTETDFVFTQIDSNIIHMYRGSLQDFYWRKEDY